MKSSVNKFRSPALLAETLAEEIVRRITHSATSERNYSIAFSGGSTPELLYSLLGNEYSDAIPWQFIQLFWGDERCVPPESEESNFRLVQKHILDKVDIPHKNVHRIIGEDDPYLEVRRYSDELGILPLRDNLPVFDLQILGLGEDGHTASVFPGDLPLFTTRELCAVTVHPVSGQKRITLTGPVLNNSESIVFIVTGKGKADIAGKIINRENEFRKFPAGNIEPVYGSLDWYLDDDSAEKVLTGMPL